MLLLHLILLQNLLLFISSISVGRGKRDGERLPYSREVSSLPIFKRLMHFTLVKEALVEIGCVVTSLVVGWLVGRWLSRACTVAKRCTLGL